MTLVAQVRGPAAATKSAIARGRGVRAPAKSKSAESFRSCRGVIRSAASRHLPDRLSPVVREPRHRRRKRRPTKPCADICAFCGVDTASERASQGCKPKNVRGRASIRHVWPDPATAAEAELFADDSPCHCGALPGTYHHWECNLEFCPWAADHPDDGVQLLYCGCFEGD